MKLQVSAAIAALLLGGCTAGERLTDSAAPSPQAKRASEPDQFFEARETDVEAPAVFEDSGAAIWDGRPTLGGVWVAHPLAAQPERVLITNNATKQQVTGALFRKDTAITGPAIMLSSDTARALGIKPGEPTPIRIVALRRVAVQDAPDAAAVIAEDTTAVETAKTNVDRPEPVVPSHRVEAAEETVAAMASESPDVVATVTDAGSEVEGTPDSVVSDTGTADPEAAETVVSETAGLEKEGEDPEPVETAAKTTVPDASEEGPVEPAAATPEPALGDIERIIRRAQAEEAHLAADIAELTAFGDLGTPIPLRASPGGDAVTSPLTTARAAPADALAPPRRGVLLPGARTPPVPARPDVAAETATEVPATSETEIAVADPTSDQITAEAVAPAPSTARHPTRPLIQIGIFRIRKNVEALRQRLERRGYPVRTVAMKGRSGPMTRVLIGPAASEAELRKLLSEMKALGFSDALAVAG